MTQTRTLRLKQLPWYAYLTDLLLWALLALGLGWLLYAFSTGLFGDKSIQTIRLSFKDANEIGKGAIVRMMGVDVGHVKDVRLRADHVEIVVQTSPQRVKIPPGSHVTILFTGLAGAKSIEFTPPQDAWQRHPDGNGRFAEAMGPAFFSQEPIRMKDVNRAQVAVARALERGSNSFMDFFGRQENVQDLQNNIRAAHRVTQSGLAWLSSFEYDLGRFNRQVDEGFQRFSGYARDLSHSTEQTARVLQPSRTQQALRDTARTLNTLSLETRRLTQDLRREKVFDRIHQQQEVFEKRVGIFVEEAIPARGRVENVQEKLTAFSDKVDDAQQFFLSGRPIDLGLARQRIQQLNASVESLNLRLSGKEEPVEPASPPAAQSPVEHPHPEAGAVSPPTAPAIAPAEPDTGTPPGSRTP
jgi:hypothetical protein